MFFIRARKLWTKYPHTAFAHADWLHRSVDVYVHHTADAGPKGGAAATVAQEIDLLRHEEYFHMHTRGWLGIGYSYIIMPSGRTYEGRGFEQVGAHTLDPKDADHDGVLVENHDIGICFAGNFSTKPPTRRARAAYWLLLARLRMKGVRIDHTYPHRAAFATSCPGDGICRWLKL
jgi:hypothetical protein